MKASCLNNFTFTARFRLRIDQSVHLTLLFARCTTLNLFRTDITQYVFHYRILTDRDPEYQKLAIEDLIESSKQGLPEAKDDDEINTVLAGVKVLENFLENFETGNKMKNNRPYLSYMIMVQLPKPKNKLAAEFIKAYGGKAKGHYKRMRTLYPEDDDSTSWDIIRNRHIDQIMEQLKVEEAKLMDEKTGELTAIHIELLEWAYSPQPEKIWVYLREHGKLALMRKAKSSQQGSA